MANNEERDFLKQPLTHIEAARACYDTSKRVEHQLTRVALMRAAEFILRNPREFESLAIIDPNSPLQSKPISGETSDTKPRPKRAPRARKDGGAIHPTPGQNQGDGGETQDPTQAVQGNAGGT